MKPLYPMPESWATKYPDRDAVQAWQLDCLARAVETGKKSLLVQAPMGTGKTWTAAKIARAYESSGYRAVFMCPLITLSDQGAKAFRELGVDFQIEQGARKARRQFGDRPFHVIASKSSLCPRRIEDFLSRTGFHRHKIIAIYDECHLAATPSFLDPLKALRPELIIGLTGTPMRADGRPLVGPGAPFEAMLCRYDFLTACRHGNLVPPVFRECDLTIDLRDVKITKQAKGRDYDPHQLREKIQSQLHEMCNVARMEIRDQGLQRCLFFAPDVGVARAVEEWYTRGDSGLSCRAVHGDLRDRDAVIRSYHDGGLRILVSCQMLDMGFDDPPTDGVILATPTQSAVKCLQQGGRGSRLYPDKRRYVCVGYRWDDGRDGPQSTLDLLLRGVTDEPTRAIARRLMLGAGGPNLLAAVEAAEIERKRDLEEERRRRQSLRVVGSDEEVRYTARTINPLQVTSGGVLAEPVIRRLVESGKDRPLALKMGTDEAARFLEFWEPRKIGGWSTFRQSKVLTEGVAPECRMKLRDVLKLTAKEAQGLICSLRNKGKVWRRSCG